MTKVKRKASGCGGEGRLGRGPLDEVERLERECLRFKQERNFLFLCNSVGLIFALVSVALLLAR